MQATEKQVNYLKSLIDNTLTEDDYTRRQFARNSFYAWQDRKYGKDEAGEWRKLPKDDKRALLRQIRTNKAENNEADWQEYSNQIDAAISGINLDSLSKEEASEAIDWIKNGGYLEIK